MIVTMNGSGAAIPAHGPVAGPVGLDHGPRPKLTEGCFDQVKITQDSAGESTFRKELTARLVGEVRTAHSTGNIQRIHEAVQSGAYRIDFSEIAAKMMLEG